MIEIYNRKRPGTFPGRRTAKNSIGKTNNKQDILLRSFKINKTFADLPVITRELEIAALILNWQRRVNSLNQICNFLYVFLLLRYYAIKYSNMAIKSLIFSLVLICLIGACQPGQNSQAMAQLPADMHKVVVKEVLQTNSYTYLLVLENSVENWLALPKMQANIGDTFYYRNGFKMTDFESKELGKKFPVVYFLESISTKPDLVASDPSANPHAGMLNPADSSATVEYTAKVVVEKEEVNLQPAEQGITIAELIANKEKYAGKTVRVKGKVTKFNTKIMKHNWIHIQDGTEYEGKFDLTATTDIEVAIGETITLEGKVALDKDFGYGYLYEILLEDSKLIK